FENVQKEQGVLKYALSREIPGLEIVYASDDYNVATVWGDANGVSVAASEKAVRDKVNKEIKAIDEGDSGDENADDTVDIPPGEMSPEAKAAAEKRRWEGYGWFNVGANYSLTPTTQPAGVDFITSPDVRQDAWKSRSGSIEIRATDDGLVKIQAGRTTK